jgi:DNA-binding transcriptional LysR family regulator
MTAVRIKPRLRFAVVGSPDYFKRRPVPQRPGDLKDHICIQNIYPTTARYAWSFERDRQEIAFEPTGPLALHDHELMIEAALAGIALAYVWETRAHPYIKSGQLIGCLADWIVPEDWLYLYYPTRKHLSAGLRAVIEALRV